MHLEQVARLGYVARGSVFLILGYFCAFAAYASTRPLDSNDTFRSLLTKPLGGILLGTIAAGLLCFAAWRIAQALLDVDGCGKDWPGCGKRIAYGFAGLFYVAFGFLALSVLFGLAHGNSDTIARDWSARLLSIPFGKWLVAAVGLTIVGIGIGTAVAGFRAEFVRRMSLPAESRRLVVLLGIFGYLTRALVFTMIGGFFLFAAFHANASEAIGVAGTLRVIQGQAYGKYLLGLTAAGLMAFGALGIAEAVFRRIPAQPSVGQRWRFVRVRGQVTADPPSKADVTSLILRSRFRQPRTATSCPPSTTIVAPVMKRPASDASSSSAPSRSRTSPKRPMGMSCLIAAPRSLAR